MDKFGFIIHPSSVEHFYRVLFKSDFICNHLPLKFLKELMGSLPPFIYLKIPNICSLKCDRHVEGFIIVCPSTPDQMIGCQQKNDVNKIIRACLIAKKLDCKIIGLAGFTSIVTNGGMDLTNHLDIPITTGNTYTTALTIKAILEAAENRNMDLKKSTIAIIGATGDIGSTCAKLLSKDINNLILVARNNERLESLRKALLSHDRDLAVIINNKVDEAIQYADIVLVATSSFTQIIDPTKLKENTIVCDVSFPPNVDDKNLGSKIFFIKGGLAKNSCFVNVGQRVLDKIALLNYPNAIYGCLAETILLTLENKFENFSFGKGNITQEKIEEIDYMSSKHGFELAAI